MEEDSDLIMIEICKNLQASARKVIFPEPNSNGANALRNSSSMPFVGDSLIVKDLHFWLSVMC